MNRQLAPWLYIVRGRAHRSRAIVMTFALALAIAVSAAPGRAFASAQLAVVAPTVSCESLASADLSKTADTTTAITMVKVVDSAVGPFCRVLGTIQPAINFEVDLPVKGWQQRYLQTGCGGLCGMLNVGVSHAGSCTIALQGGLVVASDDMGHQGTMGGSGNDSGAFGADPQKRIDFAYRGNHATALVAKALIKLFYGQSPRYSYFSGCSDGGREALVEAERYPQDFDGIAAGAPAMNFQVQNSFYHAWQYRSNTDANGKHILIASRLPILHRAAVAACDTLDGLQDGLISDPRACHFDPATVQCAAGASDTTDCLSAAEVEVARKLYAGPTDAAGHHFTVGGPQPGSELQWAGVYVPTTADGNVMSQGAAGAASQYLIFPEVSVEEGDIPNFQFTQANFAKLAVLHPLYDSTDTDLAAFQKHGNKLLLYHGWSDPHISPLNTIAFYDGVKKQLGDKASDSFMRLFLFPGMGHCGGGDGFSQFDILTPLMNWVEGGAAPDQILAAKVPERQMGPPPAAPTPGNMPAGPPGNAAAGAPGGAGAAPNGRTAPMGMGPRAPGTGPAPLPQPDAQPLKTRPVYAYPMVARYTGSGSPDEAANFTAVKSTVVDPAIFAWEGSAFFGADFLKQYAVVNGKLVATASGDGK